VRVNVDHGCAFYVLIKSLDHSETGLDAVELLLRDRVARTNLQVVRNANNLVAIPEWLDKRHAMEFMADQFRSRHGNILTVGMGDSLSDLNFMKACDYMMVPSRSQIRRQMDST
jgi:predicted mannosyl-3-phosphoglycerate phosphatase (HAD superfamily)